MLASISELDESLETALHLNYYRLNLALLHAPEHFQKTQKLSFLQDEDTALTHFNASGLAYLSRLPALRAIDVESIRKQDLTILLETLAEQDFVLESFSTKVPLTRIPRVTESYLTVRKLSSYNWDSVVPYLKFWRCFRPEGVRDLKLFDLYSVVLPDPIATFPYLDSLSVTVKHKLFPLATFFKQLSASTHLRRLHFESRMDVGDYSYKSMGLVQHNPLDLAFLERFPGLEQLSIDLPRRADFEDSLHALRNLKSLQHLELLNSSPELVEALKKVYPEKKVVYWENYGSGKVVVKIAGEG